jgi:hypothetical protein
MARIPALASLVVLAALLAPARGAEPAMRFEGNRVLNDEVYRAVLALPADAAVDEATALEVERQLLGFLRRAGYELAEVRVSISDGVLGIHVDEGRLDKVVFFGAGSLKTLRLKLDLTLPHHVFNRPYLERQLVDLGQRYGLPEVTYRLVALPAVAHRGPQLPDLGRIQGHALIPPGGRYALHIQLEPGEWGDGLGLDLGYDFPDGLELSLSYRGHGLLFDRDRWLLGGGAGAKLREGIESGKTYVALSRAVLEMRYYTPPIAGLGLRPYLWLMGDLISRQRSDLALEMFYAARLDATLNLGYEFLPERMVSLGGGLEQKYVFGLERVGDDPIPLPEGSRLQPFLGAHVELTFNPDEPRRDRRNQLLVDGRYHWVQEGADFARAAYWVQWVGGFGWHDLIVESRGVWLFQKSSVPFDEEEPVGGRYARGVFGGRDYVREAAGLALEFRLSLVRDLFKLSVFNDLAFYGRLDRVTGDERFMLMDSFGLGFHALILDILQLNLYYAFGFDLNAEFDHGLSASLSKVF